MNTRTFHATMALRIVRDTNPLGAFSADFRQPDRLQQAWQCLETGEVDWRDVEVISATDAKWE